jgi:hypothetical protein
MQCSDARAHLIAARDIFASVFFARDRIDCVFWKMVFVEGSAGAPFDRAPACASELQGGKCAQTRA